MAFLLLLGVAAAAWWSLGDLISNPAVPGTSRREKSDGKSARVGLDLEGGASTNQVAAESPGYLGPDACAECHQERVKQLQNSPHFRTCRLPIAAEMPDGFTEGKGSFQTRYPELRFEMTLQDDVFLQTSNVKTPAGERRAATRIDLVYGAGGRADDVFLAWRDDGRMFELPMAWLYPLSSWGTAHFDRHAGGDFSRPLTVRCFECHNTWFDYVAGTSNQYRREGALLGVTCENCHGPGREHVAFHKSHPNAETTRSIVHPGKLSRERNIEVCTQCHSNAIKHRQTPLSYRPGEPLDRYYKTIAPKHTEEDHVANQVQYLRRSKCFERSDAMTCVTCHDPHRPHDDPTPNWGRKSCLQCHESENCRERERLPLAVRDDCIACHMPQYVKVNVNFQTEDDDFVPPIRRFQHQIAVYPQARDEVLLAWRREQTDEASKAEVARLTAELTEHWRKEAQACRREHRFLGATAALREAWRLNPTPDLREELRSAVSEAAAVSDAWSKAQRLIQEKRNPEAMQTLQHLLSLKPDHAQAHGRLGLLHAMAQEHELAERHLRAVAEHDPDDAYGLGMLGWLAFLRGDAAAAIEFYRQADEIEPFDAKIHYHLGLCQVKLGQQSDARETFRKVLTIDPRHLDACRSLAYSLGQANMLTEALVYAKRAANLTGDQDFELLILVSELHAQVGQFKEAAEVADRAAQVARARKLQVVDDIERQAAEFRARASAK